MHRVSIAVLLLCVACGEDPVVPETGTWQYVETRTVDDTCSLNAISVSGNFEVVRADEDGFRVDPRDGNAPFDCHLSGASYDCDDRTIVVTQDGVDAAIDVSVSASGSFSSETSTSGTQRATGTCSGPDCTAVESALGISFPCSVTVEYEASHVGD